MLDLIPQLEINTELLSDESKKLHKEVILKVHDGNMK
jgi:hypothetical protein